MLIIHAEYRKNIGTKNSRKLRGQNQCPGIIYRKKQKNITIKINQNIISKLDINKLFNENIEIIINNIQYYKVKTHDIQYHPFKTKIMHIDFIYLP